MSSCSVAKNNILKFYLDDWIFSIIFAALTIIIHLNTMLMKKEKCRHVRIKVLKSLVSTNNCITFALFNINDVDIWQ